MDILQDTKDRMAKVIEHLKNEFKAIRAGRASPALVESVTVEVYGTEMRLKEMASITVPEPRQLLITLFDVHNVQAVAKGIDKANLGVSAVVEGKQVRVTFPELNQKRREDLIAQCHKKREECKISIRSVRRDKNEELKKSKLPEDDIKRLEKQIQEHTDKCCTEADSLCKLKEEDISKI